MSVSQKDVLRPTDHPIQLRGWWFLIGENVLFGAMLWATELTDVQVAGTLPSLLFPFLIGLIALVSLDLRSPGAARTWLLRLACFPSLLGAASHALLAMLVLVPPFTLGGMFWVAEVAGQKNIQSVASPNGSLVATVVLQPVGAYGRGWGHVFVNVHHVALPMVEREVFYLPVTRTARGDPMEYVSWDDDNTLRISETGETVDVHTLRWRRPTIILIVGLVAGIVQFLATAGHG
jgi:hypothetical protein